MLEQIRQRLLQLGVTEISDFELMFVLEKTQSSVKNKANIDEIPTRLNAAIVDAVCGEIIRTKRGIGDIKLDRSVSQVKVGDTSVGYSGASESDLYDSLINTLTGRLERELLCFRRLKW